MVQKSGQPLGMHKALQIMGSLPYQLVSRISEHQQFGWIPFFKQERSNSPH